MSDSRDPRDPHRRQALASLAAIGAGALAASPLRSVSAAMALGGSPAAALPRNAIDVHAHFFNASDASVVGYLTHSSSHESPRLERFLVRMQGVLQRLVRIAPTASSELRQLEVLSARKSAMAPAEMDAMLELQVAERRTSVAEALAREMQESRVFSEFGAGIETEKGFERIPQDPAQVRDLLDPDGGDGDVHKMAGATGTTIPGVFRFLGCMFQERWMSVRAFRKGYEGRGIEAVFGAMVDFEHWYDDRPGSPLADQVRLQSHLAKMHDGYMLPLIAYNPWSDIHSNGGTLAMVRDAIEHHGFIGAKIYPPVGFLPAGNTPSQDPAWRWPDSKQLNQRLKAFFSECSRLGVPVMAHANSSQGRNDEQDQYSRPQGWRDLIASMADDQRIPLVNLGHFGGDGQGEKDELVNDWPAGFAQLMKEDGGRGVYADLGYWSALRECDGGSDACTLALERLAAAKAANPDIVRRLMYGSDWFMMIKEADWKRWPRDIASAMRGTGYDLDRLFHVNALDCFGLRPGDANRKRVERFLGRAPAWMD